MRRTQTPALWFAITAVIVSCGSPSEGGGDITSSSEVVTGEVVTGEVDDTAGHTEPSFSLDDVASLTPSDDEDTVAPPSPQDTLNDSETPLDIAPSPPVDSSGPSMDTDGPLTSDADLEVDDGVASDAAAGADTGLAVDTSSDAEPEPDPDVPTPPDVNADIGGSCIPDCQSLECGDDGCGGSCGTCPQDGGCGTYTGCIAGLCAWEPGPCDDGDLCTKEVCTKSEGCVTEGVEPGPCEWPGAWSLYGANPVLSPSAASHPQGADNIYAPDILWHQGQWWMWYGGQGADGRDAVFLAWSDDLVTWQKHGGASPIPVVDHGGSNHVNDPTVVHVGGTFYMYYTEAPTGENDEVHLATSTDGIGWTKHGAVIDVGAQSSWEPDRVGRPSVLYEDGEFRMWYDGQIFQVARHVGYATSQDGFNWVKHPANPIVMHEGAIDVDRVGDWYVMLAESGQGTRMYVAKDPLSWQYLGQLFGLSGQGYDAYGQVTPFLLTDNGTAKAIFYGGASSSCWCINRIAVAFLGDGNCAASCEGKICGGDGCGGSCGGCPDGQTCANGQCVSGGTDQDCAGCLDGFSTCAAACQNAGMASGYCAVPGSSDPSACCACTEGGNGGDDPGCEGCLVGYPDCMSACQGAGMSGGTCSVPGSQDPNACCACY